MMYLQERNGGCGIVLHDADLVVSIQVLKRTVESFHDPDSDI